MKRWSLGSRSLVLLMLLIACLRVAAAANERDKWILGRWTSHTKGRPDRIIVFHPDYSWGVEHYAVSGPNEQLTICEDVRGRRWQIRGDRLIMGAPSDHGFRTYEEKIVSFHHNKIVTDIFTYTKLASRKQDQSEPLQHKLPPYDQDPEERYYGPRSEP